MNECEFLPIVLPSLYGMKNEVAALPCYEDPTCIGYVVVITCGLLYALYRVLCRGMNKEERHSALKKFLFRRY